jgi:predicted DNA-binding transcriptional regulator AlpA
MSGRDSPATQGGCALSASTIPAVPAKRIYRTRDILRLADVSNETLRRWCRDNTFPRPTKHNNRLIWDAQVVDEFFERVLRGEPLSNLSSDEQQQQFQSNAINCTQDGSVCSGMGGSNVA